MTEHTEIFSLESEYIALCDLLKCCGVAQTGGHAKLMISNGEVFVNQQVEQRKTAKIRAGSVVSGEHFCIQVQ
ncbi:RNA-binding S4 domain-containing protein [Neisseria sp. Ec49-e6-T10]|uniref:RNA-binding S4 domain-containing protein n=1 Tax=Neisseria sp. Ec49-e6-T10 TaxID=3140744 RepID=UPI003EB86A84